MTTVRKSFQAASNNEQNPNKNVCALWVAQSFEAHNCQRYLHTAEDLHSALRIKGFSVRSVKSSLSKSVGASRKAFAAIAAADPSIVAFVVVVEGHVLRVSRSGETTVDTAPRKADRRKIVMAHAVRN